MTSRVRVCAVQMAVREHPTQAAFHKRVEHFVSVASDYGSDFVCFPELFTLQVLANGAGRLAPMEAIEHLTSMTSEFTERLCAHAARYGVNIIGGSHLTRTDRGIRNVTPIARRDGTLVLREKLHATPDEHAVWGVEGGKSGDAAAVVETDCGPIGVMICYDAEFPELGRRLVDQGARLFLVPYCTDTREGHLRVRYCCHARAIENQAFVVTAGNVGNLEGVANFDIQYAQSAIITPNDVPFARDGIAAECTANVEGVVFADLDLATLAWVRERGSVRNLRDRRTDLYRVTWT